MLARLVSYHGLWHRVRCPHPVWFESWPLCFPPASSCCTARQAASDSCSTPFHASCRRRGCSMELLTSAWPSSAHWAKEISYLDIGTNQNNTYEQYIWTCGRGIVAQHMKLLPVKHTSLVSLLIQLLANVWISSRGRPTRPRPMWEIQKLLALVWPSLCRSSQLGSDPAHGTLPSL